MLAALVLRLWGIGFGRDIGAPLEFSYHLDEPITVVRAVAMAETLDLNPRWFHYPTLWIYANFLALKAVSLVGEWDPYIVGRSLSAVLGALSVGVVFLLGRRLGDSSGRAGLLGAAILSVSFLHARSSHFATTDVPMALWVALAALFALRFPKVKRPRDLWLSFVFAGLAAGTKYNGAPALLMPLLSVAFHTPLTLRRRAMLIGIGFSVFLATFLATTPFLIPEFESFRKWITYINEYQKTGQFGFERPGFVSNLAYLSSYLLRKGLGLAAGLFAVVGLAFACRGEEAERRHRLPLVIFLLLYLVWLGSYRTSFVRNLMPIVPLMAAFAGAGLNIVLLRWVDRGSGGGTAATSAAILVTALVLALPLGDVIAYDGAIARSTRTHSVPWFVENIPPESLLVTEVYGPPLGITHPGRWKIQRVWSLGLDVQNVDWFENQGVDYIIANSGAWEMTFSNPGLYPEEEAIYNEIERRYPVLKEFPGDEVDPLYSSISPTIRIYKVNP